MRAMVLWTINDFPARSSLSGWSRQGYKACATCNEDTPSMRMLGKTTYVGHIRFLKKPHNWRRSLDFNAETEDRDPSRKFDRVKIMAQLARFPTRVKGKHLSPEIDTYCAKFKSEFPNQDMKEEFPGWFRSQIRQRHIDKDPGVSASSELFTLAYGPTQTPILVNSCIVNGVRFFVHIRDDGEMYYGQLEEILEYSYMSFEVGLFRVKWFICIRNVARSHGSDGDGNDRPPPHQMGGGCRGNGTRKPNLGGRKAGRLNICKETQNLWLRRITDLHGPQPIICGVLDALPFLAQHLGGEEGGGPRKDWEPAEHWVLNPEDETYDEEHIRSRHSANTSQEDWDSQIAFWSDPKNAARCAQNKLNQAKSTVICRQGSRSLASLRDMQSSDTREYPSVIQTYFDTHTVDDVFLRDHERHIYEDMLRLQGLGSNTPSGVPYTEWPMFSRASKGGTFPIQSQPEIGSGSGSGGAGDDESGDGEDADEDEEDEDRKKIWKTALHAAGKNNCRFIPDDMSPGILATMFPGSTTEVGSMSRTPSASGNVDHSSSGNPNDKDNEDDGGDGNGMDIYASCKAVVFLVVMDICRCVWI
ncbi:arginyl-tRNA synthetase, class Ic [Tanacetum coccineum]